MNPIPDYPGYMADVDGRVWRIRGSSVRLCQQTTGSDGYMRVYLVDSDGIGGSRRVNVIICSAFHGRKPSDEYQALHNDNNHLNNRPSNLRWGTHDDNMKDYAKSGSGKILSNEDVIELRRLASLGLFSYSDLAKRFACSSEYARQIVKMERRKEVL